MYLRDSGTPTILLQASRGTRPVAPRSMVGERDQDAQDDIAAQASARLRLGKSPYPSTFTPCACSRAAVASSSGRGGTKMTAPSRPRVSSCLLYTSPSPRDGLLSRM